LVFIFFTIVFFQSSTSLHQREIGDVEFKNSTDVEAVERTSIDASFCFLK